MTAAEQRAVVVAEAQSWIGTRYQTAARVKGPDGAVDCLTLVAEVYERAGILPHYEVPYYPPDWHLHRDDERYADGVREQIRLHCPGAPGEIPGPPEPGDLVLFRFGRCYAHGGIVTSWPRLIHAWNGAGVVPATADQPLLGQRPMRFFSPFPAGEGR